VRPPVRIEHRGVELLVRQVEPRRALVVQVGQGALLQFGLGRALGVEPAVALLDELAGGVGDGGDEGVGGRPKLWLTTCGKVNIHCRNR